MDSTINKIGASDFFKLITPIILSVFAVYLTIGITLGVLPSFVQNTLHFGSLTVGIVIGVQSLATLLTRAYSGKMTDLKGAHISNHKGVLLVVATGILYLIAVFVNDNIWLALVVILLARIVHGISESMLVTGALTWGIGLTGMEHSSKVMSWNGIAMYAGIAVGAPLGIALQACFGIDSAFVAIVFLAILSRLTTIKLPVLPVDTTHIRSPFYKVIGKIAEQGLGLAFSSIGFACISTFISLFFLSKSWTNAALAFMVFGICYVLIRLFFSTLPNKYGSYKVVAVSLGIEITGQLFIGLTSSQTMAIIGCGLTGVGFSLIFPALGVLAIKKVPHQMRGTALGAYAAFFDLSLGLAGPIAGLVASWYSYQSVYLFGAISCFTAVLLLFINRKK